MKKKLLVLLLGACLLALAACSSDEDHSNLDEEIDDEELAATDLEIDTPAAEGVTDQDLLDAREEHAVELENGTFSFRLTDAYVGADAEAKLEEMGEDPSDYMIFERNFRFVLLEYQVRADSGFEDEPFSAEELLGYDLWETNLTDACLYYSLDLDVNADLNYTNVTLEAGEESTVYALYEMPEDLDAFADCLTGKEQEYWFLYQL